MKSIKPNITRTYSQIHFEDLDPKRFEDLVRQLIYDFKDWQSIEATGRGGADDGFDIRAYEKISRVEDTLEESEETVATHPMNGDLWMIQCKREQELGPSRIKKIIAENINKTQPPYGYILAVSANISKKTYDTFREELQKLGVMEFYLWGKAALEDMLFLPKNDRILFTFFGISLTTRRRSRTTEVRAAVTVKNKLQSLLTSNEELYQSILLRDIKDESYPYAEDYNDFEIFPRWKTFTAVELHPLGIIFQVQEFYGYVDVIKKEYDFTSFVNLSQEDPEDLEEQQLLHKKRRTVIEFRETFPRTRRCFYNTYGLIKYKDIALVDPKGDSMHECIHIFTDFIKNTPFPKLIPILKKNNETIELGEFKRINIFPEYFQECVLGKIYEDKVISLDAVTFSRFEEYQDMTIYASDDRYDYLNQNDVINIQELGGEIFEITRIRITCIYKMKVKDYLEEHSQDNEIQKKIVLQLGKIPTKNQSLWIYEAKQVYEHELSKT